MFSREQAAWLAGFLDGEGCFQITHTSQNGRGKRYYSVDGQLSASGVDRRVLLRCAAIAGGTVSGPIGRGNPKWKISYRWSLRGTRLTEALKLLLPFLEGKREQAALLLLLRRSKRVGARSGEKGRRPAELAHQEFMAQTKLAMHALNHRGGLPTPLEQLEALELLRPRLEAIAAEFDVPLVHSS